MFGDSKFIFIFAPDLRNIKTFNSNFKSKKIMNAAQVVEDLKKRFPNEPEYIQAVSQVLPTIEEEYNKHPEFEKYNLIERLCIPDRVCEFRITWVDDQGKVQTNMGYRIQHNNAIGPYKGGLRYHKSVNLGILKFLAFEQTFKNSLTTLPMGGAKGGSDFSPRGKSDAEVMRFCQAFMNELYRVIGPDEDVPAGDIGVGGREVGYLFGQYKKLTHQFQGVLTGKGIPFGGSLIRPEATGYGTVYFLTSMLATRNIDIKGKKVLISGAGNVAQYAAEKCLQLGAIPLTMSDSDGYIYDPDGIDRAKLDFIMELKNVERGRIKEYVEEYPTAVYHEGQRPWHEKADIALPCATQNEINGEEAQALVNNGMKRLRLWSTTESLLWLRVPTCLRCLKQSRFSRMPSCSILLVRPATPVACRCQVLRCRRTLSV